MAGTELDYYDVQAMIRDARSEIRGEIDRAVSEARDELRHEIREARRDLEGLERMVASRTEHLA